jgi:fluoride exporter
MKNILFVGLGGFLGSVVRYKLGGLILHLSQNLKVSISTLIINLTGCLIIGLLGGIIEKHHIFNQEMRLFLFTGILGGFTTFSAFGYETIYLIRQGAVMHACFLVGASVILGLFLVWLGMKLGYYF